MLRGGFVHCQIFLPVKIFVLISVRGCWCGLRAPGCCLQKAAGIATFPAQLLSSFSPGKALVNGFRPGRGQNLLHALDKQIAQWDISLVVQTAGHYRAVAENPDLIPQAVAEYPLSAIPGGKRRPVESVAVFQIDPLPDADAPPLLYPFPGEAMVHGSQDFLIPFLLSTQVPQPVDGKLLPPGNAPKGETAFQILGKGYGQIIGLKGMKGNIHLVQGGRGKQSLLLPGQQGAVGGKDHPKTRLPGQSQKFLQFRVQQRLPHKMKIQKIRPGAQPGQQQGELRGVHDLPRTMGAGTKIASEVAQVGNFQINFSKTLHIFPFR